MITTSGLTYHHKPPEKPNAGDCYVDVDTGIMHLFDGEEWKSVSLTAGTTETKETGGRVAGIGDINSLVDSKALTAYFEWRKNCQVLLDRLGGAILTETGRMNLNDYEYDFGYQVDDSASFSASAPDIKRYGFYCQVFNVRKTPIDSLHILYTVEFTQEEAMELFTDKFKQYL